MLVTDAGIVMDMIPDKLNTSVPIVASVLPLSNSTPVNVVQPSKALLPMLVTDAGIVMDVIPEELNALVPIVASVLPLSNSTPVNAVQPSKALLPMLVTDAPIITWVIVVLFLNASTPIEENPVIETTVGVETG
jgi:hypothetical protein